jgi:hypothetical protein
MSSKPKCISCGRRAKRQCPALGGPVCPVCCGSQRGVTVDCPADCEFFPLAVGGYDLWLNLDERLTTTLVKLAIQEVGRLHLQTTADRFARALPGEWLGGGHAFYLGLQHCIFAEKDSSGKTLVAKWADTGWPGLTGDEALIMRYRAESFVSVIEIQRVLDHQMLECIDMLDPESKRFVILDRTLARTAARFSHLLGWITHYPHFSKLGPYSFAVPIWIRREFITVILKRSPDGCDEPWGSGARRYLTEHMVDTFPLMSDLSQKRTQAIISSSDLSHRTASYKIKTARQEVQHVLEAKPEFEFDDREPEEGDSPDTVYYTWLRTGVSQEIEKEMPAAFQYGSGSGMVGTVGGLKLRGNHLLFDALGTQKYEFGKKMIEKYFGRMLAFEREDVVDLAERLGEGGEDRDGPADTRIHEEPPDQMIPHEIQERLLSDHTRHHYTKFLDERILALNGLSPREASRDPQARSLLVDLMKEHLCGIEARNRDEGLNINIDFVLRELGLDELMD